MSVKVFRSFSRKGKASELQTALELDGLFNCKIPQGSISWEAFRALEKSLIKKWEATNVDAEHKALELFKSANAKCKEFSFKPTCFFHDYVIGEVRACLDDWLVSEDDGALQAFGPSEISQSLMPGPGASVGANGDDFYTKLFSSTLTSSSEMLIRLYRSYISANPTWAGAEMARSKRYGERLVLGSSLSFVPKNVDISRTICTEPSVNMLFQKALGSQLEKILSRRVGIDIRKPGGGHSRHKEESPLEYVKYGDRYRLVALNHQKKRTQVDLNRELCRLGSLDDSLDGYCTIDLKSASDSISLALCRSILPTFLLRWLERTRSEFVTLPGGEREELFMVSSMGNGFTFPLQTMIFASIVRSVYKLTETPLRRNGLKNFGVFGDDIIVSKRNYNLVVDALRLFGFTVNTEKSYSEGWFRESCGEDYYLGVDVRGVYIKSLQTEADVYSSINRLNRWSVKHGVFLPNLLSYLLSLLKRKMYIPFREDDSCGIKVLESYLPASRHYTQAPSGGRHYRVIVPVGHSFSVENSEQGFTTSVPKGVGYNPDGLLVSTAGGFIRGGRISRRLQTAAPCFNLRRRIVPFWDYSPESRVVPETGGWKASWNILSYILTQ